MILKPPKGRLLKLSGHPLARNLVGYWLMNEAGGNTVQDVSGNNWNGTIDTAEWTSGQFGPALLGGRVNMELKPFIEGKSFMSAACWVYIPGNAVSGTVYMITWSGAGYDPFSLYTNVTEDVIFNVNDTLHNDIIAKWTDGFKNNPGWHHVVGTLDGAFVRIYVDGVLRDTTAWPGGVIDSHSILETVPCFSSTAIEIIDMPMLWERALSATEIQQLYVNSLRMFKRDNLPIIVAAAASGAAGGIEYIETGLTIDFSASATKGIDVSAMVDTEKALSFAASVTTGIDAKHVADTGLAVSFAASVTETDIRTFLETNRAVSAAASVSKTDTSAMKDLNKAVSASIFMVKEFTEWYGIGSEHIDSLCGQEDGTQLAYALDGAYRWFHSTEHTHWFILDLGKSVNLTKFRSRSNQTDDPIDVDIYVSDSKESWGVAVAEGINTWQDTDDWVEYDSTDKSGRYIKVEIIETEDVAGNELNWGNGPIFDAYGSYTERGSDTHQMADTGKAVAAAASVTKDTDISAMIDTGKDVSAAAAITKTDVSAMVDTAKAVSVAAAIVTSIDKHAMVELAKAVEVTMLPSIGTEIYTPVGGTLFHLAAFMVMRQTHS